MMPDEFPAAPVDRALAARIVAAYLRCNQIPPDQIGPLISLVHKTLGQLGKPTGGIVERTPAVTIRRSVQHDRVTCLECGWSGSMLRRHITTAHGLTVDAYRARWSLSRDHAMTAPAYSERRATLAKQIGLGRGRVSSGMAPEPATPASPGSGAITTTGQATVNSDTSLTRGFHPGRLSAPKTR